MVSSSANNYSMDNRQFHHNISQNDHNRIMTSQATGYGAAHQINSGNTLRKENNQMHLKSSAGYPYRDDSSESSK